MEDKSILKQYNKINWNDEKYSLAEVLTEANKGNLDAMYPAVVRLISGNYNDNEDTIALIIHYLKVLADSGDSVSKVTLGYYYENGEGVEQDVQKAVDLYSDAAAHGIDFGNECIGLMYFWGKNVPKDYAKAWMYFTKGSKKGQQYFGTASHTRYALGEMYRNGWYVKRNYKKAIKYFQRIIDGDYSSFCYEIDDPFVVPAIFQKGRIELARLEGINNEEKMKEIEKNLALVKKVFYSERCPDGIQMCISDADIKNFEVEISKIKNGPKVYRCMYTECITEWDLSKEILPALVALRHNPQDVLFIEDNDTNWSNIYQMEIICCDDEKQTYNIVVDHKEKSVHSYDKPFRSYSKLYRLAPDEKIGLREVIDLVRSTLSTNKILDLSNWEDITKKLTHKEYNYTGDYLWDKYMRN